MKRTVTFSEPVDFSDLNIVGYICDHFSTRLNGIYNKGLVILRHIDADILHIYTFFCPHMNLNPTPMPIFVTLA